MLLQAGLIDKPLPMIFNSFSVVVGLLDVVFPWILPILISVLEGIDWSMIEAARDLGASRLRSFYEVTFKLSIPGGACQRQRPGHGYWTSHARHGNR